MKTLASQPVNAVPSEQAQLDPAAREIRFRLGMTTLHVLRAVGLTGNAERSSAEANRHRTIVAAERDGSSERASWAAAVAADASARAETDWSNAATSMREAVRLIRRLPVDCRSELLASPEACVRGFALLHIGD
jgi:hypothetical protein